MKTAKMSSDSFDPHADRGKNLGKSCLRLASEFARFFARYYAFAGGVPMDLISALRFDKELDEWHDSLTPDEREAEFADHGEPITDDELMF